MNKIVRKVVCVTSSAALAVALVPVAALVQPQESVTAHAAQKSKTAKAEPKLTIARVNTGKVTLAKGTGYKLGAKASKGAKLTYKSSKKRVATVSKKGKLKARKPGKATITVRAKRGKKAATKKVKVTVVAKKKYKKVKKLKLRLGKAALAVGKTTKAKVTFKPKKASNRNVVYKSSDKKVATVSAKGKVTAKGAGTAKITVTSCANKKAKASKKLTVAAVDKPQNPYDGPDSDGDGLSDALEAELGTDPQVANAEETLPNKDIYMPEVVQVEKAAVASAQVDEGSDPLSAADDTITVSLSQLPDGVEEGVIAVFGPCEGLDYEQALKVSSIKGNASKGWTVTGSAPDIDEVFAYTKGHEQIHFDPSGAVFAEGVSATVKTADASQEGSSSAETTSAQSAGKKNSKAKMKAMDSVGVEASKDKVEISGSVARSDEKTVITFNFGGKSDLDNKSDGKKGYQLDDDEKEALAKINGSLELTVGATKVDWSNGAGLSPNIKSGTANTSYDITGSANVEFSIKKPFKKEVFLGSLPGLSAGNNILGVGLFVFLDIDMNGKASLTVKCGADVTQKVTEKDGSIQSEGIPEISPHSPSLSLNHVEVSGSIGPSLRLRIGLDGCGNDLFEAMGEAGVGFGVQLKYTSGSTTEHGGGPDSWCREFEGLIYVKGFASAKFKVGWWDLKVEYVHDFWGGTEESGARVKCHKGEVYLDSYYPGINGYRQTELSYSSTRTYIKGVNNHLDLDLTWKLPELSSAEQGRVTAAALRRFIDGWPLDGWGRGDRFVDGNGHPVEDSDVGQVEEKDDVSYINIPSERLASFMSGLTDSYAFSIDFSADKPDYSYILVCLPGPEGAAENIAFLQRKSDVSYKELPCYQQSSEHPCVFEFALDG